MLLEFFCFVWTLLFNSFRVVEYFLTDFFCGVFSPETLAMSYCFGLNFKKTKLVYSVALFSCDVSGNLTTWSNMVRNLFARGLQLDKCGFSFTFV